MHLALNIKSIEALYKVCIILIFQTGQPTLLLPNSDTLGVKISRNMLITNATVHVANKVLLTKSSDGPFSGIKHNLRFALVQVRTSKVRALLGLSHLGSLEFMSCLHFLYLFWVAFCLAYTCNYLAITYKLVNDHKLLLNINRS